MPDTATNSPTPDSGNSLFREPTSFANILYNARSLRSFLRSQSDIHEEQRRLSPEVVRSLAPRRPAHTNGNGITA